MITISNILEVEKYLDGIDGVVFDMDDTLYSEQDYVKSGYRAIAERYSDIEGLAEKLWKAFENGLPAIDTVFASERIFQYKDEALTIYREHIPDIRMYTGVAEMLERIRHSGREVGMITDGRPSGQRAKIYALKPKIDKIIVTDELGGIEYRKPNPRAFAMMSEMMQLEYERMVYVGDNIKKDFKAPTMLGMRCIWFQNPEGLYN